MAKIHTTVHYTSNILNATPEDMRKIETLIRDPEYIAASLAMQNVLAKLVSQKAGLGHDPNITATIHEVKHER